VAAHFCSGPKKATHQNGPWDVETFIVGRNKGLHDGSKVLSLSGEEKPNETRDAFPYYWIDSVV
jgi:hypothetical protein